MSTLQVANLHFETTGANRIEYTGNNVVRVRANGGFQLPFGTSAQRANGDVGLIRYNTDTGLVESFGGAGTWDALPTGPVFNVAYGVANAAFNAANAEFAFSNAIYAAVNSVFDVVNAAYTSSNADYTMSNAAFARANSALPLSGGIMTGVLNVGYNNSIYVPHTGTTSGAGNTSVSSIRFGSYGRLQHTSLNNIPFLSWNAELFRSDFTGSSTGGPDYNTFRPDFSGGSYGFMSSANGGFAFNVGPWSGAANTTINNFATHSSYVGGFRSDGLFEVTRSILFPATQVASSNANALDDYEEGTWTPGIAFGGSGTTGMVISSGGSYVKIGSLVTCHYALTMTTKGSSTGAAWFTGLPFSSDAGQRGGGAVTYAIGFLNLNNPGQFFLLMEGSGTAHVLRYFNGNSFTANDLDHSHFQNGSQIWGTFSYRTTS